MRLWRRDRELRRLEAELRAARYEAPTEFIRKLVAGRREPAWLTPRLRIGAAVAIGALALAAMASAGGVGVVTHGTKAAWHVVKRTTHKSPPRRALGAANAQYVKHCGGFNEPGCVITIFDASVSEGNSGTTTMSFTVSLDATPSMNVTVDYKTAPGGTNPASEGIASCAPGVDYVGQSGTVTFSGITGETSKTINITVCGDTVVEPNETFFVDLCCQTANATIFRSRAVGTIVNDDK
jgi:Calx-beta domain